MSMFNLYDLEIGKKVKEELILNGWSYFLIKPSLKINKKQNEH